MLKKGKHFVSLDMYKIHKKVNRIISKNDDMYNKSNMKSYLHGGQSALWAVYTGMIAGGLFNQAITYPKYFLTFPCGHGRELRYFTAAYPDSVHVASDIDKDCVDFCSKTFNTKAVK